MKRLFAFLFVGVSLISCDSNDEPDNTEEILLKKINVDVTNQNSIVLNSSEINFGIEYDNQKRVVKKTGGYYDISISTSFSKVFTNEIYTSLIYVNNKVTVENFTTAKDFTVPKSTIYYTLNASNQIEQKEVPNDLNSVHSKKLLYKYTGGKLTEIITSFPNMPYDPNDSDDYIITYSEKFYYDANDNLVKTEYFEQHNGKNEGQKIVRTFEDYDNSPNPFKRMQLLEDYFYRSLSKNNFRKYTETAPDHVILKLSWVFNYDSNGNISFN